MYRMNAAGDVTTIVDVMNPTGKAGPMTFPISSLLNPVEDAVKATAPVVENTMKDAAPVIADVAKAVKREVMELLARAQLIE